MAWKTVENLRPVYSKQAVPDDGVRVSSRVAMKGIRYIVIQIGAALAKSARFHAEQQDVRLLFGAGSDAGRIGIAVQVGGGFVATRSKQGGYKLIVNAKSAEGLFALDFPAFTIAPVEALLPVNGQPPMFAFKASPAMLAVED